MRAFYISTHKDAAERLSRGVPELNETRAELDILGTQIIQTLAKRKQYNYRPQAYENYPLRGIHSDIMAEVYQPILKILCENDRDFKLTEEIRRVDHEILSLLQKRILKAYDVAAYKKKHKKPIQNKERENEVLENAASDAEEYGIGPEIGRSIMKIIIEKTKKLEEIII